MDCHEVKYETDLSLIFAHLKWPNDIPVSLCSWPMPQILRHECGADGGNSRAHYSASRISGGKGIKSLNVVLDLFLVWRIERWEHWTSGIICAVNEFWCSQSTWNRRQQYPLQGIFMEFVRQWINTFFFSHSYVILCLFLLFYINCVNIVRILLRSTFVIISWIIATRKRKKKVNRWRK